MLLKRNITINTLKKYLIEEIKESLKNLNFPLVKFNLTTPKNEDFGDLSTILNSEIVREIQYLVKNDDRH